MSGRLDIEYNLQDELDGAALRRLREADEKVRGVTIVLACVNRWHITVEVWRDGKLTHGSGEGATIAEAADKCREALS